MHNDMCGWNVNLTLLGFVLLKKDTNVVIISH